MTDPGENYEITFSNRCRKGAFSIYGQNKTTNEQIYKPQDVILSVTSQLKAFQVADSTKINTKPSSKDFMQNKRSKLICLNQLPIYVQAKKQDTKFNTQCITDSQLRNIIETAEILEAHQGISQEFETTFVQTNTEKYEVDNSHVKHEIKSVTNTEQLITDTERSNVKNTLSAVSSSYCYKTDDVNINVNFDFKENIKDLEIQNSQILNTITCKNRINKNTGKSISYVVDNNKNIFYEHHDSLQCSVVNDDENKVINDGICSSDSTIAVANSKYCGKDTMNDRNLKQIDKDSNLDPIENTNDNGIPKSQILNSNKFSKRSNVKKGYDLNIISTCQDEAQIQTENYSQMLDQDVKTHCDNIDRATSTIFCNNILKRSSTVPSPLIFNLDKFEHFESIAFPIIDSTDFDKAKHVINSQILNNELHIKIHDNTRFQNRDVSKGTIDKLINEKSSIQIKNKEGLENNITKNDCSTDFTNDQILFSSDEEDCVHRQEQDLPFTCALETSFCNQVDVLDNTMYVGFQTASNRSIKVFGDSFAKAKSLLNDIDDKITVTNLVKNTKNTMILEETKTSPNVSVITSNLPVKQVEDSKINDNTKDVITEVQQLEGNKKKYQGPNIKDVETSNFIGFRTANNKNITLSKNSLARYKKVFQDIDLNEDFETRSIDVPEGLPGHNEKKQNEHCCEFNTVKNLNPTDTPFQGIDDEIMQEFVNIDMSLDDIKKASIKTVSEVTNNDDEHLPTGELLENIFVNETNNKTDVGVTIIEGFKTASNKIISISKDAWAKSKSVFADIDETDMADTKSKDNVEISKRYVKRLGYYITDDEVQNNNRNVPNRNDYIDLSSNTRQLVEDTCNDVVMNPIIVNNNKFPAIKSLEGFRTANNKDIKISDKAMLKTKKIFNDIESICFPNKDYPIRTTAEQNKNVEKTNVTKPSNDNRVMVSKDVCESHNMKIIFEQTMIPDAILYGNDFKEILNETNIDSVTLHSNKPMYNCTSDAAVSHIQFNGFKTASNKIIKVSHETLSRTKYVFKDIDSIDFKSKNNKKEYPHKDIDVTSLNNNEVINYKNLNVLDKPNCQGFKTSRNNHTKMSPEAFIETKNKYEDIGSRYMLDLENKITEKNFDRTFTDDDHKWDTRSTSPVFNGLKFVNKNRVTRPVKPFENCKGLLKDCDSKISVGEMGPFEFMGFLTASNRQVKMSEKALASSRKIFKDIDNIDCDNRKIITKPLYPTEIYQLGNTLNDLYTTVDKPITQNNAIDSIKATHSKDTTKPITENKMDNAIGSFKATHSKDTTEANAEFTAFKAANNKIIKISDETLTKTKNIFKDIDLVDFSLQNKNLKEFSNVGRTVKANITNPIEMSHNLNTMATKVQNDKAASNKCLKTKEVIENHYLHIASNMPDKSYNNIDSYDVGKLELMSTSPEFKGFLTGNKKPVTISETALKKSKQLFRDIENDMNMPFVSGLTGFQTASNKQVTVSEKALFDSKKIFNDIDEKISPNMPVTSGFACFQTASNKQVTVSKTALDCSKKIFTNIDNISYDSDKVKRKPLYPEEIFQNDSSTEKTDMLPSTNMEAKLAFKGFHTASRKPVSISKSALEKSKKLFQGVSQTANNENIEATENITQTNNQLKGYVGFDTDNNKIINVTDKASVSKRVFSEIEEERNESLSKKDKKDIANVSQNLHALIDRQVIINFDETLYTDDFRDTPERSKRSGSPILSCPRVKKRKKFETPYNLNNLSKQIPKPVSTTKNEPKIIYREDYKKNKKCSLKDIKTITKDKRNEIDPYLFKFNYDNLLEFQFSNTRNDLSSKHMTIDKIKEYFMDSVNAKLVPNGWLENHLKLIIWKLVSYEIKFKSLFCTVKNVLEQLKYRYKRELYNAERPALRKILERDDIPSKTLVLCVVEIYADGVKISSVTNATSNIELTVSDGWYCVRCTIDRMLSELVCSRKITVGCKLVTSGAEIISCEQGVSPWEDTSAVRLKIFGNSTRRARWDARLGYHNNGAILSHLSAVKVLGGKVSKLRVFITRVYPALYVEKFEDGSTVTRSERLENLHQMKMEADRQIFIEKVCEEVEKEFVDRESEDSEELSDTCKKNWMESGSQIAKMAKRSKDPVEFTAQLTNTQTRLLENHTSKNRDKMLQEMQAKVRDRIEKSGVYMNRNVISLLKIRVAGLREKEEKVEVTKGMMSIWKPTDAVGEMIKEGAWVDIMNVVPTALRFGEIQISAGRQSIFSTTKLNPSGKFQLYTNLLQRKCYTIKDLAQNPSMLTEYNEIDTVGFIFSIDPPMGVFDSTKQSFQNMYLTDTDSNIICVHFWGGLKKFGFQNILDTGEVVTCINLLKRAGNTRKCFPQFRVTELSCFTLTPRNEDARKISEELNKTVSNLDRRKFIENCIVLKNNYSVIKNNENLSPHRCINNSDMDMSKNKIFIDSPLNTKLIQENLNFSGLDFESTFKQDTQLSAETLKRKRKVNEKIAKLEMYGEPPPLTHINIINSSKKAYNSYKSPILLDNNKSNVIIPDNTPKSCQHRIKNDGAKGDCNVSANVASEKNTPQKCKESNHAIEPVLNRTYVKHVNPVKINFDMPNSDKTDPFAEEFDTSPPLSLDDYSL